MIEISPTDQLLEIAGHRKVSRVVTDDSAACDTLLDLAATGQTDWTPKQWATLLRDLRRCQLTVEEWVTLYT